MWQEKSTHYWLVKCNHPSHISFPVACFLQTPPFTFQHPQMQSPCCSLYKPCLKGQSVLSPLPVFSSLPLSLVSYLAEAPHLLFLKDLLVQDAKINPCFAKTLLSFVRKYWVAELQGWRKEPLLRQAWDPGGRNDMTLQRLFGRKEMRGWYDSKSVPANHVWLLAWQHFLHLAHKKNLQRATGM